MTVRHYLQLSVAAALATIALKTLAWWLTDSVGLLSDALESFVNLAAAVFGLTMVTIAHAPADDGHPYGHSKAEYFSSGFEGLLILGAAGGIAWAAVDRLLHPQPITLPGVGVALSMVSSAINGGVAWLLMRASREHRSIALEADARHLYTDVWTSVVLGVGILFVPVTGWLWLDPVMALLVAANISREASGLIRRTVDGLMDRALEPAEQQAIEAALQALAQPGVRFDDLRTRSAAQARFCQLHMHVPEDWTLAHAAQQRAQVERRLHEAVRGLQVTIELLPMHVEPIRPDEAAQDRARPAA
ncbi:MAG: cation transporter [Burkholderiales bacterium]|nr:cation transporter [Burkholderiales bacterium]